MIMFLVLGLPLWFFEYSLSVNLVRSFVWRSKVMESFCIVYYAVNWRLDSACLLWTISAIFLSVYLFFSQILYSDKVFDETSADESYDWSTMHFSDPVKRIELFQFILPFLLIIKVVKEPMRAEVSPVLHADPYLACRSYSHTPWQRPLLNVQPLVSDEEIAQMKKNSILIETVVKERWKEKQRASEQQDEKNEIRTA